MKLFKLSDREKLREALYSKYWGWDDYARELLIEVAQNVDKSQPSRRRK